MTIDTAVLLKHLQGFDWTAAAIGATAARSFEAAVVQTVRRGPALLIGMARSRVQKLAADGKIDAPTLKLLKAYAAATFDWVDEQLPDSPGDEKMNSALDRIAAIPYLGALVRADRAGAQIILQAAYDAINQEAKSEKEKLGGSPDAQASQTPAAPTVPTSVDAGAGKS